MAIPENRPPIEIGLVLAGEFTGSQQRLLKAVKTRLAAELEMRLPAFLWQLPISIRRDIAENSREQSSELLRQATEERNLHGWDFALLIIDHELIAHYRSFALAALSRPLDAAVISTSRIFPDSDGPGNHTDLPDDDLVIARITTLLLRALAHLGGLKSRKEPKSLLNNPGSPAELDAMDVLSEQEERELIETLTNVADQRLEETMGAPRSSPIHSAAFVLRAGIINREQIVESLIAARPWQFPRRLSRLTTAAVTTVTLLMMTAEGWDLGLSQSWQVMLWLSLIVIGMTTQYICVGQKLLLNRSAIQQEQIAVTHISAYGIVLCGLLVTWLYMFTFALAATYLLFPQVLVSQWIGTETDGHSLITLASYAKMGSFCASLGILIGALGASFEDQYHFQHVIFVDEEL